jgi:uncharacterized protein YjbJ (UPF0337 family)
MADRVDEFKGRVKETAGRVTDNERLEAEGKSQAEGARAGRKAKGALREVGGSIKEGVGKLTGDEATEAEGKADKLRGRAQKTG